MPLAIVRDDIVRLEVDAIVNAANGQLLQGGGVCGAIFAAAGARELQAACDELAPVATGQAVATPGFRLKARHVIHAVGPVWRGGDCGEEQALRSCYRTSLQLAESLGAASIAFPLISSGIYGYPKSEAIDIALEEIRAFLDTSEMDVRLVLFDAASHGEGMRRFAHIAAYIDDVYVRHSPHMRRERREVTQAFEDPGVGAAACMEPSVAPSPAAAPSQARERHEPYERAEGGLKTSLRRLLRRTDAPFSTTLLRMIDERGLKDSDVYKRANMSRQHFSKIRGNPSYRPKKHTVLALAVALQLSLDDTRLLLERAGFALTHADERDIIVEYFIAHGLYDIYEINLALYSFDQPLLG